MHPLVLQQQISFAVRMGKYDPLSAYLRRQNADQVEMSFLDIERKLGAFLPKAAMAESWWLPSAGAHTKAWREAGFEASPALKAERVVFSRDQEGESIS